MQTNKAVVKSGKIANDSIVGTWIEDEVGGCNFKDVRLARRFSKLLGMMSDGIGVKGSVRERIGSWYCNIFICQLDLDQSTPSAHGDALEGVGS